MQNKTTREDIAKKISQEFGIPYVLSYNKIENIIKLFEIFLLKNDLSIKGLGTFKIKTKNSRIGRNPRSKVEYIIKTRKVITFKKSNKLKL